jgi:hypothetical protein
MVALNTTASLWSKRLPVLAREGKKLGSAEKDVTPNCCFILCNVCCWVNSC